jgi:hypothetical protein
VKKASEYREHAADCRKLAFYASTEEDRQTLMRMAQAWEEMAKYREQRAARPDPEK